MNKHAWEALKALYYELYDLDREAQLRRLEEIKAQHPDVAAQLEPMLLDPTAHRGFEQPAYQKLQETDATPVHDLVGTTIDKYEIKKLVGSGGMGHVYLARRNDELGGQNVAIKIIQVGYRNPNYLARFHREQRILSKLNHPHISRIYDGGMTQDGQPYLVMEYVEGMPLIEYCQKNDLSLSVRLALFRDLCDAVTYAHNNFIMHRDLKPSNILVTDQGIVKVIDFGIAKTWGDDEDDQEELTISGYAPLTVGYASPEQLAGRPLTVASDVFSLGVILYELLTDNKLFKRKTSAEGSMGHSREGQSLSRPSQNVRMDLGSNRRQWRKKIQGDLDNVVLKALKEHPKERYASVDQLSEDIYRYENAYPVLAQPDTFTYRFKKYAKRNRSLVALGAILFLAITSGVAGTLWQSRIAAEKQVAAEKEAEKATAIKEFLVDLYDAANPYVNKGEELTATMMLDRASQDIPRLKGQSEVQAELYHLVGDLYRNRDEIDASMNYYEKAVQLYDSLDLVVPIVDVLTDRSRYSFIIGDLAQAMQDADRAILKLESHGLQDHYLYVEAKTAYGRLAYNEFRHQDAVDILLPYEKIVEQWESPSPVELNTRSRLYTDLAIAYQPLDPQRALDYMLKALEVDKISGNLNLAKSYQNIGNSYAELGKADSAILFAKKALLEEVKYYPDVNTDIRAYSNWVIGQALQSKQEYEAAMRHIDSMISINKALHGEESFLFAFSLSKKAFLYLDMDRPKDYLQTVDRSNDILERLLGLGDINTVNGYWDAGYMDYTHGLYDEAVRHHAKAIDGLRQMDNAPPMDYPMALGVMAVYTHAQDAKADIAPILSESLKAYQEVLDPSDSTFIEVRQALVVYLDTMGRSDELERWLAPLK